MEWFEKILDVQSVRENNARNLVDLSESAQFKWAEDASKKWEYNLFDGIENKIVGTMKIRDGFKKSAECEIFNKKYSLVKKGLFNPRILIYEDNNNKPVSTFYYGTWKGDGVLSLADGKNYFWELYERLNNEWIFYDNLERELLQFKPRTSFYKSGYYVHIKDKNIDRKNILFLMMLGIFNLIISPEEVSVDAPVM